VVELAGADCSVKGIGSLLHWLYSRMPPGSVRALGVLNRQELDRAYQRAWVVLSPSRWDTFPNSVLEAMARSKPLVVSPHGGAKEMLEGTQNFVAPPAHPEFAEAVCRVLADRSLRYRLGYQARRKAEAVYAPARSAQRYVRFFEENI
jgi:glycosyltransferase involved in cell wall biosynthesis